MRPAILPLCALTITTLTLSSKMVESCEKMSYENRNQVDYGPLRIRELRGKAIDPDGVSVPGVCVGLFTEFDHKLIAATATERNGEFRLENAPAGDYRLVAKYPVFGTANARVRLGRGATRVVLRMRMTSIDTTSYVESK